MLSAHAGHIVGVSFSPADGGRCYTSSYDGVSRCLDLERQQLEQVRRAAATDQSQAAMTASVAVWTCSGSSWSR